jgi:hypothetical protein
MKRVNLLKSRFSSLLPKHLKICTEITGIEKKNSDKILIGTILSEVKRREILVKVNELKVVEYYSR